MRQIGTGVVMYVSDAGGRFPRSSHSALSSSVMPWGYAMMSYFTRQPYTGPGPAWDKLFNSLYRCPADDRRDRYSYGKSVWFELTGPEIGELSGQADGPTYERITDVRQSSATLMFGELGSGAMADHIMAHFWNIGGAPEVDRKRHGKTSNYVFVDGHAEAREFESTFLPSKQIDNWNPAKAK
jgi:prepilin-type processing-associated H-X9-DG protein